MLIYLMIVNEGASFIDGWRPLAAMMMMAARLCADGDTEKYGGGCALIVWTNAAK